MSECKDCKLFKGDCGHHYIDGDNHVHYDCPSMACTNRAGYCEFYQEARTQRQIVKDALIERYVDTHEDYYVGLAIRVIANMSDETFDRLERGEAE